MSEGRCFSRSLSVVDVSFRVSMFHVKMLSRSIACILTDAIRYNGQNFDHISNSSSEQAQVENVTPDS